MKNITRKQILQYIDKAVHEDRQHRSRNLGLPSVVAEVLARRCPLTPGLQALLEESYEALTDSFCREHQGKPTLPLGFDSLIVNADLQRTGTAIFPSTDTLLRLFFCGEPFFLCRSHKRRFVV